MTRLGKIARLPKAIRDRLNQQIQDGIPSKDLVRWLNGHNEVRDVLLDHFNAKDITEQNLSEWKQGGYQDWLKHQERLDWIRRISDEAEDLAADAGLMPWMERVGSTFEVILGKVVEQQLSKPIESPEQLQQVIELSREISRHRRLSQDAARWRVRQEERQSEQNHTLDEKVMEARQKALMHVLRIQSQGGLEKLITQSMDPEQKAKFDAWVHRLSREYLEGPPNPGFAEPSDEEDGASDPTESDSIRPDPTSFSEAA